MPSIQPGRFSGAIQLARQAADSPLDALAGALDNAVAFGVDVAGTVRDEERDENDELLASPLITQAEAIEIENEAFFPISKIHAQNRRGELMVNERIAELEDLVSKAPDTIEARRLMRDFQSDVMAGTGEEGVQAGIRERLAHVAPSLLNNAAANRIQLQAIELDQDRAASQRVTYDIGAETFVDQHVAMLADSTFVNPLDQDRYFEQTLQTLGNQHSLGVNLENGNNARDSKTIAILDSMIATGPLQGVSPKNIGRMTAMRSKIITGAATLARSHAQSPQRQLDQNHADSRARASRWKQKNPNTPFPDGMVEDLTETARLTGKPSNVTSVDDFVLGAGNEGTPVGIIGTDEYDNGRDLLKSGLIKDGETDLDTSGFRVLSQMHAWALQLDPQIRKDPIALNEVVTQYIEGALVRTEATNLRIESLRANSVNRAADHRRRAAILTQAGKPEDAALLLAELKTLDNDIAIRARADEIKDFIASQGLGTEDMIDTHTR
jgi:hypothetical protein